MKAVLVIAMGQAFVKGVAFGIGTRFTLLSQDRELDPDGWRTNKKGEHYHIDDNRKIDAGMGGQLNGVEIENNLQTEHKKINKKINILGAVTSFETVPERYKEGDVYKNLGEDEYKSLHSIVFDGDERCRELWKDHETQIRILDKNWESTAYYDPARKGILFSLKVASAGDLFQAPFQLFLHESGHMIDDLHGRISETFRTRAFPIALANDVEEHIDNVARRLRLELKNSPNKAEWLKMHKSLVSEKEFSDLMRHPMRIGFRREYALREVEKEIKAIPHRQRTAISDIYEGVTSRLYGFDKAIHAGIGHQKGYWDDVGKVSSEAFAQFYSASLANQAERSAIKERFPSGYKVFDEIIRALAKEKHDNRK